MTSVPNHGMRIGGVTIGTERAAERCIVVHNPFSGEPIASVPKATLAEVRQAFAIGKAYKPTLTRFERANILNRGAALVRERSAQVAQLISAESGLCMKDASYEAGRVADVLVFGANECLKDDGQIFSCD
jgi:acyl-CoA reductase-like NAD-dependent aldehyde dehydrogenase